VPASSVYKRGTGRGFGDVAFNMTPLIDCTLLLIVFFILTSQIASSSLAVMQLSNPRRSTAVPRRSFEDRVVINVICAEQAGRSSQPYRASHYEIDGVRLGLDQLDRIGREIRRRRRLSGSADFTVEIRADRRVAYEDVWPLMTTAERAGVKRVGVTALLEGTSHGGD